MSKTSDASLAHKLRDALSDAQRLADALRQRGYTVEVRATSRTDHGQELSADIVKEERVSL